MVVVVGKAYYSGGDIHRGVADRWSSDVAGSGKLRLHGDRQRTRQLSVYGPTSGFEILLNFICVVPPAPLFPLHSCTNPCPRVAFILVPLERPSRPFRSLATVFFLFSTLLAVFPRRGRTGSAPVEKRLKKRTTRGLIAERTGSNWLTLGVARFFHVAPRAAAEAGRDCIENRYNIKRSLDIARLFLPAVPNDSPVHSSLPRAQLLFHLVVGNTFQPRVARRYKGFRLAFDPATVAAIISPDDTLLRARQAAVRLCGRKERTERARGGKASVNLPPLR